MVNEGHIKAAKELIYDAEKEQHYAPATKGTIATLAVLLFIGDKLEELVDMGHEGLAIGADILDTQDKP